MLYKEPIAEATQRICRGELGVEAKESQLIGFLEVLNDREYVHSVSMVFLLSTSSDKFVGDFQSKKIKAFTSLPKNTLPSHKDFLALQWQEIVSILN